MLWKHSILHWEDLNRSTTLKLLRNFGSAFLNIQMFYCNNNVPIDSKYPKFLISLELYLAEYCLKSLKTITFASIETDRKAPIQFTEMQFPNIESVFVINSDFASGFSFETNFPNLQSLSIRPTVSRFNIKNVHFPAVKSLELTWGLWKWKWPNCIVSASSAVGEDRNHLSFYEFLRISTNLKILQSVSINRCWSWRVWSYISLRAHITSQFILNTFPISV